jgi:glycerol-3-phosphate dehydrogenase
MQIEYYDGQFDDSRYSLALAQTAALYGATVVNHCECVDLLKDDGGSVVGATVRDTETNQIITVHARVVVNATGPFTDSVRRMADPEAKSIIMPSAGMPLSTDVRPIPNVALGGRIGLAEMS